MNGTIPDPSRNPLRKDSTFKSIFDWFRTNWKTHLTILITITALVAASSALKQRHKEIETYLLDYNKAGHKRTYNIRGPLTPAEVEKELLTRFKDSEHLVTRDSSGNPTKFSSPGWINLINQYETNDELYHYRSDQRSWWRLQGRAGYVLIRGEKVVTTFGYSMS